MGAISRQGTGYSLRVLKCARRPFSFNGAGDWWIFFTKVILQIISRHIPFLSLFRPALSLRFTRVIQKGLEIQRGWMLPYSYAGARYRIDQSRTLPLSGPGMTAVQSNICTHFIINCRQYEKCFIPGYILRTIQNVLNGISNRYKFTLDLSWHLYK